MQRTNYVEVFKESSSIECELKTGDHLKQIRGMDYFKTALDYEVVEEYPYHYLIGIKYRDGLISGIRNYVYTSVSKASIYCGAIVLIKKDGSKVKSVDKCNSRGENTDKN